LAKPAGHQTAAPSPATPAKQAPAPRPAAAPSGRLATIDLVLGIAAAVAAIAAVVSIFLLNQLAQTSAI